MAAYVIALLEVTDPEAFESYRKVAGPTFAPFGGKPVVVDGALSARRRLRITMSCDHRVIDGATGAAFLRTLKQMLENPLAMLL